MLFDDGVYIFGGVSDSSLLSASSPILFSPKEGPGGNLGPDIIFTNMGMNPSLSLRKINV